MVINGTKYTDTTPSAVIEVLERACQSSERIRIFLGDAETGRDWCEEYDTMGVIGRSCGLVKIPLLIKNVNSIGGRGILDDCIVKITVNKQVVYQHANYSLPTFDVDISNYPGYHFEVYADGKNMANFKTEKEAMNYISFLKGETNRKG